MAQMLRHKVTGELFIFTDAYSRLPELELVVEDPVAKVVAEELVKAESQDVKSVLDKALEVPVFGKPATLQKKHGK